MSFKRLLSIILMLLLACTLLACGTNSDYWTDEDFAKMTQNALGYTMQPSMPEETEETEDPDEFEDPEETPAPEAEETPDADGLKGEWVLVSAECTFVQNDYEGDGRKKEYTGEPYIHYLNFTLTENGVEKSTRFSCQCEPPHAVIPGRSAKILLKASKDGEKLTEENAGICCYCEVIGHNLLTDEMQFVSEKGYDYSDHMYYPLYAGNLLIYGHLGDEYGDGMSDYIGITMPVVTKTMFPSGNVPGFTIYFWSSAANSQFRYEWVND